jgi:cytochrome c oxidase subunit 2
MQSTILIVTLVLMIVVALPFLNAVRAAGRDGAARDVEKRRKRLIWALLIAGIVITAASLRQWPHAIAAGDDVVHVNVTGGQWYWEIGEQEVPAGKTVVFNLQAKDVNHGFGVIDASGRLLFQTQAMPGYVNQVQYIFDEPGEYRVLCMEFCGVAHHDMIDTFNVVAN